MLPNYVSIHLAKQFQRRRILNISQSCFPLSFGSFGKAVSGEDF
jgi:hypothetical protein